MINNRHGPHPAVSYYRSGALPSCDIACNDNRLYEVEWERCARAAPVIPKIRDALAALGDCFAVFAENPFKRRGHKGYAEYAERNLCSEGFAPLSDSLARFAVSKRKVPIAIGSREGAKYAKKLLCSEGFAALGDSLARFAVKQTSELVMT